jgi:hypothetical protein
MRTRQPKRREPFVITAGIVIFAAGVLICASLIAVPLWKALVGDLPFSPISDRCSVLMDAASRDACYEKLRAEETRHPAKGANAPITTLSPDRSN